MNDPSWLMMVVAVAVAVAVACIGGWISCSVSGSRSLRGIRVVPGVALLGGRLNVLVCWATISRLWRRCR